MRDDDYEVEHDFPDIGGKTILLNARQILREKIGSRIILLYMEDITELKTDDFACHSYSSIDFHSSRFAADTG